MVSEQRHTRPLARKPASYTRDVSHTLLPRASVAFKPRTRLTLCTVIAPGVRRPSHGHSNNHTSQHRPYITSPTESSHNKANFKPFQLPIRSIQRNHRTAATQTNYKRLHASALTYPLASVPINLPSTTPRRRHNSSVPSEHTHKSRNQTVSQLTRNNRNLNRLRTRSTSLQRHQYNTNEIRSRDRDDSESDTRT